MVDVFLVATCGRFGRHLNVPWQGPRQKDHERGKDGPGALKRLQNSHGGVDGVEVPDQVWPLTQFFSVSFL